MVVDNACMCLRNVNFQFSREIANPRRIFCRNSLKKKKINQRSREDFVPKSCYSKFFLNAAFLPPPPPNKIAGVKKPIMKFDYRFLKGTGKSFEYKAPNKESRPLPRSQLSPKRTINFLVKQGTKLSISPIFLKMLQT